MQDGAGLEALSAKTSEISTVTRELSQGIAEELDHLVLDLSAGVKDLGALHSVALERQKWLMDEGCTGETGLHNVRDEVLSLLVKLSSTHESLRTKSAELRAAVDSGQKTDELLNGLQGDLLIVAKAKASHTGSPNLDRGGQLQAIREAYTMAPERSVFTQVVEGQDALAASGEEGSVEMFDQSEFDETALVVPTPEIGKTIRTEVAGKK